MQNLNELIILKKNGEEEKVKLVLTDEKLSAIKAMLEKDHAIDCLLLLHLNRGKWKDAKDFMRENKLTLSDGTFRSRMIEIEPKNRYRSFEEIIPIINEFLTDPESLEEESSESKNGKGVFGFVKKLFSG